jgi:membrane protein
MEINAPKLGAALAFYTMLSIAPLIVVSIAIAGLVLGDEAAHGQIFAQLYAFIGPRSAATLQDLVQNASKPASGITATAVGLFVLIFAASGVFGELRDSLNTVWKVKPAGDNGLIGLIKYRFASFAMVLGTGFLLLVSLILGAAIAAMGKFFTGYLPLSEAVLQTANWLFSFVAVTVLFAMLYRFVPDADIQWRDVWIGAAVTSALFSGGKLLIGLYLGKASIGSAYGAAGSLVVFLVWVYYSAQIFFLARSSLTPLPSGTVRLPRRETNASGTKLADSRSESLEGGRASRPGRFYVQRDPAQHRRHCGAGGKFQP